MRLPRTASKRFRFTLCLTATSLTLLAAAAGGCGDGRPKRVPISGRVLIDGRPLEIGFVQVVPVGNRPARGDLGPGGCFTLTTFEDGDGCVLGNHPLIVIANESVGATVMQWHAPKKYTDLDTSGLTIQVDGPRDDVELHLTWKGNVPPHPYQERLERE